VALLGEPRAEMTPQDGALRLQSESRPGARGSEECSLGTAAMTDGLYIRRLCARTVTNPIF
jgi:hypothetical protein